mmetsp:Transcript_13354/g.34685  ORF Transcript_13354/g.34685 Transcript_13354/m.34685 type:complete len:233 (+) Transcript_13354:287-985(+)
MHHRRAHVRLVVGEEIFQHKTELAVMLPMGNNLRIYLRRNMAQLHGPGSTATLLDSINRVEQHLTYSRVRVRSVRRLVGVEQTEYRREDCPFVDAKGGHKIRPRSTFHLRDLDSIVWRGLRKHLHQRFGIRSGKHRPLTRGDPPSSVVRLQRKPPLGRINTKVGGEGVLTQLGPDHGHRLQRQCQIADEDELCWRPWREDLLCQGTSQQLQHRRQKIRTPLAEDRGYDREGR